MSKPVFSALSRRNFLTTAATAGSAMLLSPAWLHALADEADPRIVQVLSKTIAIDMHNHVYPTGTEPHPEHGPGLQTHRRKIHHHSRSVKS